MPFFSYWFWPNPGGWYYADTRVQVLLGVCVALIVLSLLLWQWRKRLKNNITKNLSKTWGVASFSFGAVGCVLVISRVEMIQFLAMRAIWVLFIAAGAAYVFFQFIQFRRKHYTVLGRVNVVDERDKYLPGRK